MEIGVIGSKNSDFTAEVCNTIRNSGKEVICVDGMDAVESLKNVDVVICADYLDVDVYRKLSKHLGGKVISLLTVIKSAVKKKCICKIAILEDTKLFHSGVLQREFESMDIILLMPQEEEQQWVDRFKQKILAGTECFCDINDFVEVVENLKNFGGQSILVADEVLYHGIRKYGIKGNFIYPVNEILPYLDEIF